MKLGDAFKQLIHITPAGDGSFVVDVIPQQAGLIVASPYGFSNVSDLLDWLVAHAQAASAASQQVVQLSKDQIVEDLSQFARDGVRRTTAAQIIREREEKCFGVYPGETRTS